MEPSLKQEVRVLVADNSTSFRMYIERVVAVVWPEATVVYCRDGMAVLEYFEESAFVTPALVLLDLGRTSFDVLKWLREQRHFSDLPVIVWSGVPLQSEKLIAEDLSATDYLKKPETFEELLAMVRGLERYYRVSNG